VYALTSGHPYLTQNLCFCIWAKMLHDRKRDLTSVTPKSIYNNLSDLVDKSSMISDLWDDFKSGQIIALMIAHNGELSFLDIKN
jgi:hypothetical protein